MEWLPCPHCGNKELQLLWNSLCELYGKKDMANVYCNKCQSQAPQKTWNKRTKSKLCREGES